MYDKEVGESEWSTAFVDMPYKDTSNPAQFQAYLSDLSTESLMGSWLEVGDIAGTVEGDQLPLTNKTLTASDLDVAFPGFSAKYGADTIVDVKGNCTTLHDFTTSQAN